MKITDRLIGDHKTFRKMIQDLDTLAETLPVQRDKQKLRRLVGLFKDHLVVHAWFEDNFYYPAVREVLSRTSDAVLTPAYMKHLEHEHKSIDGYLDRLESEVQSDPIMVSWPQTYALFHHGLRLHMKKEEDELFPASERLLGSARLEELSKEMERHRADAPKARLHPRGL